MAISKAEKARRTKEMVRKADEIIAAKRNQGHKTARSKASVILPIADGAVFVVSDQHYYPGHEPSPAHKASLYLAARLKPVAIINNGDSIDGASISRWPASSYAALGAQPTVFAELTEAQTRLREFEDLKFVKYCIWNMGNHDARFETRLADKVPEYAGINGFTLKDHIPGWVPAWSTWIGERGKPGSVVIKHRFKGGMYAANNNALWAGVNMVTGHDHTLWAKPITDYTGTRWGMTAGTLAAIDSLHFLNYTEDNPVNWQSGFLILHFRGGVFTGPEQVHALPDGRVLFRGDILEV